MKKKLTENCWLNYIKNHADENSHCKTEFILQITNLEILLEKNNKNCQNFEIKNQIVFLLF